MWGHFWGILETRFYMRARAGLAEALWELGERDAAILGHAAAQPQPREAAIARADP